MKKLIAICFAISILANIQFHRAEAYDLSLGKYDSGLSAYLMTETIRRYWDDDGGAHYIFSVKAVYPNSDEYLYVDYEVIPSPRPWFQNSQGYSGWIDRIETHVEWKALQYLIRWRST